ncbi:MAG: endonuclease/exonuclease/phosphatase family protein [Chloroflexota bacterium]
MGMLRFISYNIRCNTTVDGENAWPFRRERVASLLQLYRPDLLGLQEVLQEQLDYLVAALPEFGWIGAGRDDGQMAGEYVPIFYRRSQVELIDSGVFWLSETPDVVGSRGWDASLPRTVTWANFVHKETNTPLICLNTHFDHRGPQAQVESAHLLRRFLATQAEKGPSIVSGDFNCTSESSTYQALTADVVDGPILLDTMFQSQSPHHGPSATFNSRFADPLDEKIDYIFCLPGTRVLRHAVLADHWDGLYPSDHLPVLVDIELEMT